MKRKKSSGWRTCVLSKTISQKRDICRWYSKYRLLFLYMKNILELKEFFHSESFLKYLSLFYGYKLSFTYDMETINSYTNGGALVQTFTEGNHLNWHDDRDDAGMVLYYLNYDWTSSKWGELELGYTNDTWEYICYDSITPEFNKLVILIPKIGTYHRVSPIKEGYLRKWLVEHLSFQK